MSVLSFEWSADCTVYFQLEKYVVFKKCHCEAERGSHETTSIFHLSTVKKDKLTQNSCECSLVGPILLVLIMPRNPNSAPPLLYTLKGTNFKHLLKVQFTKQVITNMALQTKSCALSRKNREVFCQLLLYDTGYQTYIWLYI